MLKLDQASYSYRPSEIILENIQCEIKKGEFVGVYGPSGSGKSTFAKIIVGHIRPTSGTVFFNHEDVSGVPNRTRILIHQDSDLFPWLRTDEQLALAGNGISMNQMNEVLEMVRLKNILSKYPYELSVGMRKRLALARALLARPEVIVLDETLSSLELELRHELALNLKEVWSQAGITFVVISHLAEELKDLTTQTIEFSLKR